MRSCVRCQHQVTCTQLQWLELFLSWYHKLLHQIWAIFTVQKYVDVCRTLLWVCQQVRSLLIVGKSVGGCSSSCHDIIEFVGINFHITLSYVISYWIGSYLLLATVDSYWIEISYSILFLWTNTDMSLSGHCVSCKVFVVCSLYFCLVPHAESCLSLLM